MITFSNARTAFDQYRRRRQAARQVTYELGVMTDSELSDLGISRTAIPGLAREAAASVS